MFAPACKCVARQEMEIWSCQRPVIGFEMPFSHKRRLDTINRM